jgi:hypothetical protein
MTEWTDYVKKYAADNGVNYKQALKDASGPFKARKNQPAEPIRQSEPIVTVVKSKRGRKPKAKAIEVQ